jgi:SAM-dependent methyltransferase
MAHSVSDDRWDRVWRPLENEKERVQRDPNGGATAANADPGTVKPMDSHELNAMITTDDRHWWYRGRRRVLRATLDGLELASPCRILDAGCGSGRTLDELADYGDACGVDLSPAAVDAARMRGHAAQVGSVTDLPFDDASFDLVTCLDVIEHTRDDRRTLGELRRVTRPGGTLLVTVPAHPTLWSAHDEVNRHYRRYTRSSLVDAAVDTDWDVAACTYFNAALLAPAAVVRVARRRAPSGRSELSLTPPALDRVLEWPSRAEAALLRSGARVPFGLSLLAVLRAAGAGAAAGARDVPAMAV